MWYNGVMDKIQIIIYDKDGGEGKKYFSPTDTISKMKVYDSISQEYSNDKIEKICIEFDPIEIDTLDRGKVVKPIDSAVIDDSDKLSKLKEELGKYYG